jgi:hypothetical protein
MLAYIYRQNLGFFSFSSSPTEKKAKQHGGIQVGGWFQMLLIVDADLKDCAEVCLFF